MNDADDVERYMKREDEKRRENVKRYGEKATEDAARVRSIVLHLPSDGDERRESERGERFR